MTAYRLKGYEAAPVKHTDLGSLSNTEKASQQIPNHEGRAWHGTGILRCNLNLEEKK